MNSESSLDPTSSRCTSCNSRHVRVEVSNPSRNHFVESVVCGKCRHKLPIWSGNGGELKARKRWRKANAKRMRAAARHIEASDGTLS